MGSKKQYKNLIISKFNFKRQLKTKELDKIVENRNLVLIFLKYDL